jgi:hypothetical protein
LTSPAFSINENGFRNTEVFKKKKPANTLRILMLGGSVLYSGRVPGAVRTSDHRVTSRETIAQYLERRLKSDSAFSGVHIEVINAGVNYNQIREVTLGYLSEYIFWEPDLVIICGSANNFGPSWPAPLALAGVNSIQVEHPWKSEFDRMVNDHSFESTVEVMVKTMSEYSAAVGLLDKLIGKSVDMAFERSGGAWYAKTRAAPVERRFAPPSEIRDVLRDYMGYSDAIQYAAKEHDQKVAFFWEYFLGEMNGLKPLSSAEKSILPFVRWRVTDQRDLDFHLMVRDTLQKHIESIGGVFVDPLPELSRDSGTVYIDYLHYTTYGNRLMADVMYRRLASQLLERARSIQKARQ